MFATVLPFLMSANDAGIVSLVIFLGSSMIFGIPVFATRGMTQLAWAGAVGFALTIEIVLMVIFVTLTNNGTIHPHF